VNIDRVPPGILCPARKHGRTAAVLVRVFGDIDIDIAEDAIQEALPVAVDRWPSVVLLPSRGMDHHLHPKPGDRPLWP
jgi:hypothetical protein